jgi:RNA polymerase sigma factor (sigma-70 family)
MTPPPRSSVVRTVELAYETLEKFRQGDAQAFRQVLERYAPLVRHAVSRFWSGAFEREEAMQEVWTHVFRNREALDLARASSFSGWLAVLTRRKCIDLLRRADDPAELSEEEALEWIGAPPEQESAVEHEELDAAVRAFKQKLEPKWREFFELCFVRGLDYDEVSARLSISKLRCKYMRKVLSLRARKNAAIMAALGRPRKGVEDAAS